MTLPHRVLHKATHREAAPFWIVYLVVFNTGMAHLLWYTDAAMREEFMGGTAGTVLWLAAHAADVGVALGVIALVVGTFRKRQRNERADDR